jgi:hypothetical protein
VRKVRVLSHEKSKMRPRSPGALRACDEGTRDTFILLSNRVYTRFQFTSRLAFQREPHNRIRRFLNSFLTKTWVPVLSTRLNRRLRFIFRTRTSMSALDNILRSIPIPIRNGCEQEVRAVRPRAAQRPVRLYL